MNTKGRTQSMGTSTCPSKHSHHLVNWKEGEEEKEEVKGEMLQENGSTDFLKKATKVLQTNRDRKIALQQEIDKLKKRLRHEENVHRALERAFTRPLGVLPRLPPYLPPQILELLAEVAVLEEEVVRLEEQVVDFRQGLYQEAILVATSRRMMESASDLYPCPEAKSIAQSKYGNLESSDCTHIKSVHGKPSSDPDSRSPNFNHNTVGKKLIKRLDGREGKENHITCTNSTKNSVKSSQKRASSIIRTCDTRQRSQDNSIGMTDEMWMVSGGCPNSISEDLIKCLMSIYKQISSAENRNHSRGNSEDAVFVDPYGVCFEFGKREIGPYKYFLAIDNDSIDLNSYSRSSFLIRKLRVLLKKLESVELKGLKQQHKLAFWINIYNSCVLNWFLENGVPSTAQMVAAAMQKAMINVGGRLLSAMTIEHFILRLPYNSNDVGVGNCHKELMNGLKNGEMATHSFFGLDWPEPLVTFALSCGSWSSPAVRVYTAAKVESELETAKRDYLQAAVGISKMNKLAIPKLLDWYLLDFAKDTDSLLDWICLQLPVGLRNDAVVYLEQARRGVPSQSIKVLPYEFSFRYLLAT